MTETPPTNGRELVAAGRLTALHGSVEITDRELVQMSARSYRGAEIMLQRIVDMNPHLLFTQTRDVLQSITHIEWEPREHHLLRGVQLTLVERIKSAELRVSAARESNEIAEKRVRSLEQQLWDAKREWDAAKRRVTNERKTLTMLTDERAAERTYPELDTPPVETVVHAETTHAAPVGDLADCPCCGRSPFELPRTDRLTSDDTEVTCTGWAKL